MSQQIIEQLNWEKMQDLIPAIIQDYQSSQVLMLGYMNKAALQQTLTTKKVTFYSRAKQQLWVKGETSGHYLSLINIVPDCDNDSLLILVKPEGPTCHTGDTSCFNVNDCEGAGFLHRLEDTIAKRQQEKSANSYTTKLFNSGKQRIAQKVGEEAVETILAAMSANKSELINETADLLYHLLVLLQCCGVSLKDVGNELANRQAAKTQA